MIRGVDAASPSPEVDRPSAVVPQEAKWPQRWAAVFVYAALRTIAATIRFRFEDRSGLFQGCEPEEKLIFAVWHNRLALVLIGYRRHVTRFAPRRRLAGMVSASRDGGFLTHVLRLFDVEPVRGSSSRRGSRALREMIGWAEQGYDLAITPDGPRGPCYKVQEGVISAAQWSGLPIVPASYFLSWKIRLSSWDRFQVPLPFSRCDITIGKVVRVPRDCSDGEREALRQQLEAELRTITRD
jgi:lysophospholipid acyltransferase (LPLAT)-like uncharacterized protein